MRYKEVFNTKRNVVPKRQNEEYENVERVTSMYNELLDKIQRTGMWY